jgi:hypothetical protein
MEAGGVMGDTFAGDGEPLAMVTLFESCKLMLTLLAIDIFWRRYRRIANNTAAIQSRPPNSMTTHIQSLMLRAFFSSATIDAVALRAR